jgi:CRP-like cAMP-binding protein
MARLSKWTPGAFRHAMEEEPDFGLRIFRYLVAVNSQTTQTAACNGRHDLEQRLARWLLIDRAEGDEFQITQEFLTLRLWVYRPSVSVVASALQRAGMIRYGQATSRCLIAPRWRRPPAIAMPS